MRNHQAGRRSTERWLISFLLLATTTYALAEDMTLTTYYPSPRGVYNELRTTGDVSVGRNTTPLARLHVIQPNAADAFRVDDQDPDATPVVVDQSGNVGIGTAVPTGKLHVADAGDVLFMNTGNVGIGTASPAQKLDVTGNATVSGNVGIGTTTLTYPLNVNIGGGLTFAAGTPEAGVEGFGITNGVNSANTLVVGEAGTSNSLGSYRAAPLTIWANGRMHIDGEELLYLLNQSGVIVGQEWGGNGNLTVEGVTTPQGGLNIHYTSPGAQPDGIMGVWP